MWQHARRQMRDSLTRLVAAGLAIVLGTAFIAATLLSSEVIESTARSTVSAELDEADLVVTSGWDAVIDDGMVQRMSDVPGVAQAHPQYVLPEMIDADGQNRYVELRNAGPGVAPTTGERPSGTDVVLSEEFAQRLGLVVGDSIRLGDPTVGDTIAVRISGLIAGELSLSNEIVYTSTEFVVERQQALDWPAGVNLVLIYSDQPAETLIEPINVALGSDAHSVTVLTAESYTNQQIDATLGNESVLMWFGLAFAALAIIVAGLVISNTFEVLVAQRTRTLAMLRCVGASTGQVRSSVLWEALVLGAIASVVGAVLGLGFGQAAVFFLESRNLGVAVPRLTDISPWVLIVPVLVGVAVTLVAASGPARAATRVSPVAALRPTVVEPVRGGGRGRLVTSVLLVVGGGLVLAGAVAMPFVLGPDGIDASALMGISLLVGILGGLTSLIGVLVGGVFVVPSVIRLLGGLAGLLVGSKRRATVRLATANAIRNPRRSATTASALVIGVTLVVLMGTGAASARTSLDNALGEQFSIDVIVENFGGPEAESALTDDNVARIEAVPGVTKVALTATDQAWVSDPGADATSSISSVIAVDPQAAQGVVHGAEHWPELRLGEVVVPTAVAARQDWESGDVVDLVGFESEVRAPVTVQVSDEVQWLLVSPETQSAVTTWQPNQLLVAVDDQADLERVLDDIAQVVLDDAAFVHSPARERASYDQVINALLAVVIGLLGVSVVIALVGVANTLSLSVLERRREHGVLRAVGVTRGQLRGMLSTEGVLLALTGSVIGVVLGVLYGWAGSAILLGFSGEFAIGIAPGIMLGALAVGLIAGLIASVVPARSAIKVPPVVALNTE